MIPDAPNTRTPEITAIQMKNGSWHDRGFIRQTLADLGMQDIRIELVDYKYDSATPRDAARSLWPVMGIFTGPWKEKKAELGWNMFECVEEIARTQSGDGGNFGIRFVSLVVTAKKPQ